MTTHVTFTPPEPLKTAVLFLVFNRPEVTAQVFEAIRQAKPPRLYVAADGAREGRDGEAERCAKVRRIATAVDWPCEVKTLFRDKNLGCKMGVSSGISWFFENEEEGIILEDDCLPSQSFFWFCEEMLGRYRGDTRVWQVCGSAFVAVFASLQRDASYLFSKYGPIWGWASWRRAWVNYDSEMLNWPYMKEALWLNSAYSDAAERKAKLILGDKLFQNQIDTWDYQWGFNKNFQSALSIVPIHNLVVNVGFGADATHTKSGSSPTQMKWELEFPLQHPKFVLADVEHDRLYCKKTWARNGRWLRKVFNCIITSIFNK